MRAYETTTSLPVVKQSSALTRIFSQSWKIKKKKEGENYFLMGCAQLFPKVLLRLLNNFLQRTNRGCVAVSEKKHIFPFLGRFDGFSLLLISMSVNLLWSCLCERSKHSCHRHSTLWVQGSTLTHRKCLWLGVWESQVRVTPQQCLIEECLCVRAAAWHTDGLWHSFSLSMSSAYLWL